MDKGLPTPRLCGPDELRQLLHRHLRLRGDSALLEIDDAGGEQLDPMGALGDAPLHAGQDGRIFLHRPPHELAVALLVKNRRAGTVQIGHRRALRPAVARLQRQAHAVVVSRIAHRDHPEGQQPLKPPLGQRQQGRVVLLQIGGPLGGILLAALEKQMGVGLDQTRQHGVPRQHRIGDGLPRPQARSRRRSLPGKMNLVAIIDEVRVPQRRLRRAANHRADPQPDGTGRGRQDIRQSAHD